MSLFTVLFVLALVAAAADPTQEELTSAVAAQIAQDLMILATNGTNSTTDAALTSKPDCSNDHSRHSPCNRIDTLTTVLIAIGSIAGIIVGLFFLNWVCPRKPKEEGYQQPGQNM